jgi:hypothetical protein
MAEPLLSTREVAELLGIRVHSVLSLIASGDLKAADVSIRQSRRPRWKVAQEDIDSFLLRRTRQPATKRRRRRKSTNVKQYF